MLNFAYSNSLITITPIIHSITDVSSRYEKGKLLNAIFEINIDDEKWEIPFQNFYSFSERGFYKVQRYTITRYLNIPFFEIEKKNKVNLLIRILLVIESNHYFDIELNDYYSISASNLLYPLDIKKLTNLDKLEYVIQYISNYPISESHFYNREPIISSALGKKFDLWASIPINLRDNISDNEIIFRHPIFNHDMHHYRSKFNSCLLILPLGHKPTFANKITQIDNITMLTSSLKQKEMYTLFRGSYSECYNLITNQEFINNAIDEVIRKSDESDQRIADNEANEFTQGGWKKDYFNALTDGQFGNFDDFEGEIDDIKI